MKAAGGNRHGHRDATMILLAFRHRLRASELCSLRWDQVELAHGRLHVSRVKNGVASVHPLTGIELRALRRLQREQEPGRYIFMSERHAPISAVGFRRMMGRLGKAAKMPFSVHPHMLRHACGFKLANDGQDTRALQQYLGHRIFSTPSDIRSCPLNGSKTFGRIRSPSASERPFGAAAPTPHPANPKSDPKRWVRSPFRGRKITFRHSIYPQNPPQSVDAMLTDAESDTENLIRENLNVVMALGDALVGSETDIRGSGIISTGIVSN